VAVLIPVLDFHLPAELEATAPPEDRGRGRDDVRLLVARTGSGQIEHRQFPELLELLAPGDLLVVNRSATVNAALDGTVDGEAAVLHLSRHLEGRCWIAELRHVAPGGTRTTPWLDAPAGTVVDFGERGSAVLCAPAVEVGPGGRSRLWIAELRLANGVPAALATWGHPITYGESAMRRPLAAYQTVFAAEPGSAEMPSAGRPFTCDLVTRLLVAGIDVAAVVLHAGVSSLEASEPPQAEAFQVPPQTAERVNSVLRLGGRVVAVGTTVVRALESAAVAPRLVLPASGLTDLVIGPAYEPKVVTGLLTGWHEPRASHLAILEAIAGRDLLERSYEAALDARYLWHEFGDSHLVLP
jgi:S-adenosylmethionine:tRNA ribosyltransferase-isomerase